MGKKLYLPNYVLGISKMIERKNILTFKITFLILSIYITASIIGMLHHEIWLDEAQHFLIARDSGSLSDVYYNMRYDGHPRLWNFLLFFITHFITNSPEGMQVFHLLITTTIIYFFLRYAPFDIIFKILIIFGYYFLFEYNLLSRNYALGILFLFNCCFLFRNTEKNLIPICILIILLCNTHLFYMFTSVGIFLALIIDYGLKKQLFTTRFIICSVLFLAGVISTLIQVHSPSDNATFQFYFPTLFSKERLLFTINTLSKAYFPVPLISYYYFWNTYELNLLSWIIRLIISFIALIFPLFLFNKSTKAIIFYYTSTFLIMLFVFLTQMAAARYFGMIFIFFIAAYWISKYEIHENKFNRKSILKNKLLNLIAKSLLYISLLCQLFAGVYAYAEDYIHPFSQAKNTVNYLRKDKLTNEVIVVDGYNAGPSLSAYLQKKLFYLDINQPGSFCNWKKSFFPAHKATLKQEIALSDYVNHLNQFVLISNKPIGENEDQFISGNNTFTIKELQRFENSIVQSENYYVYYITRYGDN